MEYVCLWLIGISVAALAASNPKPYTRFKPQSPRVKTTIGLGNKVEIHK